MKGDIKKALLHNKTLTTITLALFFFGASLLWAATLRIPDLSDISGRKVVQSTKIYDRTGQVLLYDMSPNLKRTVVSFDKISDYLKKATLAIEDKDFYNHGGVKFSSLARAFLVDLATLSFSQGGSTITQQVVKNTILNGDKTPTRKIKEWILAEKLDKALPKDQILNIYLNESPYGGSIYGVEEASLSYFGKEAKDVSLAEAAYIASMTKAPTYYSPYGEHRDKLEERKNLVLNEMLNSGFITKTEHDSARAEKVTFLPKIDKGGLRAPHFVFFVIDYLANKYGEEALTSGGLKVTTTLDYDIQTKAEAVAKEYGQINEASFNADNDAIVVIDPKTGGILSMVGSRDYFDPKINGNFNVATAHRQPGSTFKPFVYSTLFNKGYTPDTILFDLRTQFNSGCEPNDFTSDNNCYSPDNYDHIFRGPMTIRDALAQSINVPAVKALYLAGIQDSLDLAKSLGVEKLMDPNQYGLTLVLGGGEVSLLDMTSAYSVFANDGVRNPYNAVLKVEDKSGAVLEEYTPNSRDVLSKETARNINSILSDNKARIPAYGENSALYIPSRPVAVKTGTTNDYKDAWIMGYAPNLIVGAWVGNNENTPMEKKVAGFIVAPLWRKLMDQILPSFPVESFGDPEPVDQSIKPILRGVLGNIDQNNFSQDSVHDILYYVDKDNPLGPPPVSPESDPQYKAWEYSVRLWANSPQYRDYAISYLRAQLNAATGSTSPNRTY
ncbi:MAG: transglycosylase domain-containing protein [Minisyncoccia bacterium]